VVPEYAAREFPERARSRKCPTIDSHFVQEVFSEDRENLEI